MKRDEQRVLSYKLIKASSFLSRPNIPAHFEPVRFRKVRVGRKALAEGEKIGYVVIPMGGKERLTFSHGRFWAEGDDFEMKWNEVRAKTEELARKLLSPQAKVVGYTWNDELEKYAIRIEVPLEAYYDLEREAELAKAIREYSAKLGIPFFPYLQLPRPNQHEATI